MLSFGPGVRLPVAATLTVGSVSARRIWYCGAGLLDVEDGNAQVAVVRQRQVDQPVHAGIAEILSARRSGWQLPWWRRLAPLGALSGNTAATGAAGRSYFGARDMQPDRASASASGVRARSIASYFFLYIEHRRRHVRGRPDGAALRCP